MVSGTEFGRNAMAGATSAGSYEDQGLRYTYLRDTLDALRKLVSTTNKPGSLTPEEFDTEWQKLVLQVRSNTPNEHLPGFSAWDTSTGEILIPGQAQIGRSGRIYTLGNNPQYIGPDLSQFMLQKYVGNNVTPDKTMDEYQKAQVNLAQQRIDLDVAKMRQDQQMAQQQGTSGATAVDEQRIKEQLMKGLEQPTDWIKRWQLEHTPLPSTVGNKKVVFSPKEPARPTYEGPDVTPEQVWQSQIDFGNKMEAAKTEWRANPAYQQWAGEIMRGPGSPPQPTPPSEGAYSQLLTSGWNPPSDTPPEPNWVWVQTPPAPSWLPQFAPNQVAGQPISQQDILTPSGQQWARTNPTVRAALQGYTDWTQQRPYEHVMAEMNRQLPGTPKGAGYTSWTPRSRWA